MNSKQKNTDANAKKQSPVSSTAIKIFDEGIGTKKKKKKQEYPKLTHKSMNLNVLANAGNKFETHQQEEQDPQQVLLQKKKKGPYQKKKVRNKNKDDWNKNYKNNEIASDRNHNWNNNNSNNNHVRNTHYSENYHHHQRSNNQEYYPYEEANMLANQNISSGFQPSFSGYIPGSQHTFPTPHPQQNYHNQQQQHHQQHLFAGDGNAKILLEPHSNGGGVHTGEHDCGFNNSSGNNSVAECNNSQYPLPCKWWVDMIDNNTMVDALILSRDGESMLVPIPTEVGVCLAKELLVQKEDVKAFAKNQIDDHNDAHNTYETANSTQGRRVQGNVGARGSGHQGTSTSLASVEHQPSQFVEPGVAYSMVTTPGYPHPRSYPLLYPNNYSDYHIHHGMALNQHQSYNGCSSFPPPGNNAGAHNPVPTSYHPLMHQRAQYQPMYSLPYPTMLPVANVHQSIGSTITGYARPDDLHANAEHTGPASDEAMNGESYANAEGSVNEHYHASNIRRNMETTPDRAGANQAGIVDGVGNAQIHNRNQNVVTPHRGAIGGNGEGNARRVSISPMVPSSQTLATASNDNM